MGVVVVVVVCGVRFSGSRISSSSSCGRISANRSASRGRISSAGSRGSSGGTGSDGRITSGSGITTSTQNDELYVFIMLVGVLKVRQP